MTLDDAIAFLREQYMRAEKLSYIRDKTAWALYQTWREADDRGPSIIAGESKESSARLSVQQRQQSVDENAALLRERVKPTWSEEWTRQ